VSTTMWVAGSDLPGAGGVDLVHNPATEEPIASVPSASPAQVDQAGELGRLMTLEGGKPLIENTDEVTSAERFYVLEPVFGAFVDRLVTVTRELRLGDPLDPATDVGPMVAEGQRARVEGQLERAVRGWRRSARPSTSTSTGGPTASHGGIPMGQRVSLEDRVKQIAGPADGGRMSTARSREVRR
jgi:hypothetical protein